MSSLAQLTGDAIPALAASVTEASPPELLTHLACRTPSSKRQSAAEWQSFHFGRRRARQSLTETADLLGPYAVRQESMTRRVTGPTGEETLCLGQWLD